MSSEFDQILGKLQKSKFRRSFHLEERDKEYIEKKGIEIIRNHCFDFLDKRIKIKPKNEGKQTPFKGHPVFRAQHALAICCRECIKKWHKIDENKILNEKEINYLSDLIIYWIKKEMI